MSSLKYGYVFTLGIITLNVLSIFHQIIKSGKQQIYIKDVRVWKRFDEKQRSYEHSKLKLAQTLNFAFLRSLLHGVTLL